MDNLRLIRSDLDIAWRIASLRLRGQMQYRSSFLMQIFGNFIINFGELIVLYTLFQRFDDLGGWSLGDVLFLHGMSLLMFGIGDTLSQGLRGVPVLIREGTFDRVLIRPMSSFVQALVTEVSLRHLGLLAQGLLVFGLAIGLVEVAWSPAKIGFLCIVIVSGAALFLALFTIEAIVSFWTVNSLEAINAFTYGGSDLGQYPLHIFDQRLRWLFLWIIPIGFLTYYPALYILDKPDPLGLPGIARFVAPVAAGIFCAAVAWGWNVAIRHYRSTGS
ncbi:MAG: ABC-2 family transporter protein [Chloroflexota bacterium]|nr:ABC-2 family transporter protein [Chloroflexota bacterium]